MVIHLKKKAAFHVKKMQAERGKDAGKRRNGVSGKAGLSVRIIRKGSMRKTEKIMPGKQDAFQNSSFGHDRRASPYSSHYQPDDRMHLSGSTQSAVIPGQSVRDGRYFSDSSRYVPSGEMRRTSWKKDAGYQKQERYILRKCQTGQAAERPEGRKNGFAGKAAAAGAKTAFRQMEGGDEFYDACMTADILAAPVKSAADSGRDLYRRQAAQKAEKRIRKVRPGDAVRIKEPAGKKEISKTAEGTGSFKTVSVAQTEDSHTVSVSETVHRKADKLKIRISRTAHMAEDADFRTVPAAEKIPGTDDKKDWKTSRTAVSSGTGVSSAPAHGREPVRTGSGLKIKGSDPIAVPKAGVLNPAVSEGAKMPETRAAPGIRISRMPERKTEMAYSRKKTDIHISGKDLKQKNKAVAGKKGRTASGTAGIAGAGTKDSVSGRPAARDTGRRGVKHSVRNRMVQIFISKQRQQESRDSTDRVLRDIVVMNFTAVMKHAAKYAGLFFAGTLLLTALLSLPVMAVLTVIYDSPFAICFPSISSAETTQQVLSAYVEAFNGDVEAELGDTAGYDRSERIYVNFTGDGIPDNYCDMLAVYMVKYGIGDTATDMTDRAGQNLKSIFNDMCSYSISVRTETAVDEEGNETVSAVKYVNVELKTWQDMMSGYGFHDEEQEILAELMKPENTALMGYSAAGGGQQAVPGQQILPEQYQAAVDAVSDENGRKVLEFALSKVGYPYSQALRDSGTHFDCSSLAFYAWQNAGVNISYQGSATAASEAQLCYDNNWLVHYDEMKPGDLIFYSYHKNGRFMDISHVAVYAGNGMAVEAANTRLGVVYRAVTGKASIVMIGRPGQESGR